MKIGIRGFTLTIFVVLGLVLVGFWSVYLGLQFEREQTRQYLRQIETWQAQVSSAQNEQLLWLQARFYDARTGLRPIPTNSQRLSYLESYQENHEAIRWAGLISLIERNDEQTDCERLAQSLYAETDDGAAPVFFSCLLGQQPIMGVRGDFRIYGRDTGLVLLMDYYSFLPRFEQAVGISLQPEQTDQGLPRYVEAGREDSQGAGQPGFEHEIIFNRGNVALGGLGLQVRQDDFLVYWMDRSIGLLPVLALLVLAWWSLSRALVSPLQQLFQHMQPIVQKQRPGAIKRRDKLAPGLKLLQRYFMILTFMARQDPLTGLHNRVIFEERVQQALLDGRRSGRKYALVLIDLVGFRKLSREVGHYIGDGVLRLLAERLLANLRETDSVARLEEDNFALLLEYGDHEFMAPLLDKIYRSLSQPYEVYDSRVDVTVGLGVSIYPDHAQDMDDLLGMANKAMLEAQRQGGGVVFAQQPGGAREANGLSRMQSFRQALEQDEFKLVFQPVVSLANHNTGYFEALLRWKKPGEDQLSIPQIIELAEKSRSIHRLSRWIIDSAAQVLEQLDRDDVRIAINLSMVDFHDKDLPDYLESALLARKLKPRQMMLEITESQIMSDQEQVINVLNLLSEKGFSMSIDDFGTGQASLAYLRNLPVEKIKIDQSFVFGLVKNEDDRSIVESTVELAHRLGLEVVAEGVESAEIHQLIEQMNCDYAQGFYISKPMDAGQVQGWLEKHARA